MSQARRSSAGEESRSRILDAAEALFADHGYDGVSIRQITEAAGVQTSMVNYYFGSKDALWSAVFERRSAHLGESRRSRLDALERHHAPASPPLESLIDAFVRPILEARLSGDPGWQSFTRLIAQASNTPNVRNVEQLSQQYDPTARRFIAAFGHALPDRSEEEVMWGFSFLMGAMLHIFAETRRVDRLSDGHYRSASLERITDHLTPFLAAGFRACRAAPDSSRPSEGPAP
ncbi:HTH-type transcriptional repressor NicS [Oceanibacterium hippocampi]|uniref:HTH-type transcriptional repressor NicS n=2 Tax=Oceanibacterium hippocampi TaxID=745714 RepID=A0A1Y5TXM3_9PROT|nr:HTH-type transcriptional repressor NicS [Oceanibacterium hippocampi]